MNIPVNISSNQVSMTIIPRIAGAPVPPLELTHFNPESDIISPSTLETADAMFTADGKLLHYAKNNIIEVTVSLGSFTYASEMLSRFLIEQRRNGNKDAILNDYTLIVNMPSRIDVYIEGTLSSGTVAPVVGSQYIQHCNFTFKFGNLQTLPRV